MSLDAYTFWIFAAGLLAGAGVAVLVHRIPDLIVSTRNLADHVRHRPHVH